MANLDNAVGFTPITDKPRRRPYTVGATAVKKGDIVGLSSTGLVELFVVATHLEPVGVVRHDAAAGASVELYDNLDEGTEFWAQFDAVFAQSHVGGRYDFKGTTGIQEVDGSNSLYGHIEVLGQYEMVGSTDLGQDAKVRCRIRKSAVQNKPVLEPGDALYSGTLAGHVTLVALTAGADELRAARYMKLDPGGAGRNVTLGATLHAKGRHIHIMNAADAAESLTIKNSAGTGIAVLNQNERADFIYSGSAWVSMGASAVVDISA